MNPLLQQLQALWDAPRRPPRCQKAAAGANLRRHRLRTCLGAPIFIVMVLAMMVLPLPPSLLDVFFTFNIAMALMVMMVAAYMLRPLDFAAFPGRAAADHAAAAVAERGLHPGGAAGGPHRPRRGRAR
jgi:hypothetical protein